MLDVFRAPYRRSDDSVSFSILHHLIESLPFEDEITYPSTSKQRSHRHDADGLSHEEVADGEASGLETAQAVEEGESEGGILDSRDSKVADDEAFVAFHG